MTKSKIFLILSLSFIGGVAASSFLYPKMVEKYYLFLLLAIGVVFLALFRENKKMTVAVFGAVFFIFGFFLVENRLGKMKNLNLDGQNFSGEAVVAKEPEQKGKYQKIIVSSGEDKILLNLFDREDYAYGDVLQLACALKIPENFSADFDYRMYLFKDGIFYECQKPQVKKTGENRGNRIYAAILFLKSKFNESLERLIPAPEAGLASGLVVGGSDLLSQKIQDDFSKTGLTHIVAVSGYNVTIIAEYLMIIGIFLGLWRQQAFWFAVFGIVLFVVLVGFPSSAVRAGVMGILLIWAMKNGRLANSKNAIIFSAAIMLMFNPLLLRWDIGFQLSFLATLGVVYFYPVLEGYLFSRRDAKFCVSTAGEILFLTLSAQIFVLPIILFNFGNLSLISPVANLLILPLVPLAMLLSFLAGFFNLIFHPLGVLVSFLAYLPLKYETILVSYLSSLKYASVEISFSWWMAVGWYIILGGILRYVHDKKKISL